MEIFAYYYFFLASMFDYDIHLKKNNMIFDGLLRMPNNYFSIFLDNNHRYIILPMYDVKVY